MAWAYFKKIWSSGVLGLMVSISIIGVALGVTSLVVTLSVMNGFHSKITSKLLALNPHLIIMNPFLGIGMGSETEKILHEYKGITSYSTFVFGKGLLQYKKKSQGIIVKGILPNTSHLRLYRGDWRDLKENSMIIGEELANSLYLSIKDEVYLILPRIKNLGVPMIPRIEKFRVVGIFNSGMYEYDSGLAYINITKAKELFIDDSSSSGMELYLSDPFNSDKVAVDLRKRLGGSYRVSSWKDRNSNLFAALKLEKTMMFIVLVMIILVATFNIAGLLIMVSMTRSRDCGIMRALGATRRQIRLMFNFKGLMIGFLGTGLGVGAGLLISLVLSKYDFIKLPPKVYLISTLPVKVDIKDIIIVIITALLISLLSTIYPAYRAGHLEVAEQLKYE